MAVESLVVPESGGGGDRPLRLRSGGQVYQLAVQLALAFDLDRNGSRLSPMCSMTGPLKPVLANSPEPIASESGRNSPMEIRINPDRYGELLLLKYS
jgi:hypothetical protein